MCGEAARVSPARRHAMSADDADGAAPAVQIFCAIKDQPIRKTKKVRRPHASEPHALRA